MSTPTRIEVELTAHGTFTARTGSKHTAKSVWWTVHRYGDEVYVVVRAIASGPDFTNRSWMTEFDAPPEWVPPAPEWFHRAVKEMREATEQDAYDAAVEYAREKAL